MDAEDSSWLLLVGLGNIGPQYAQTRHNIGFMIVDALATAFQTSFSDNPKLKTGLAKIKIGSQTVLLSKPTTLMNRSGQAIQAIGQFYKIPPKQMLIIYDDTALPFGRVRFRDKGSPGSHNGMKSVLGVMGTQDIARLRVGIEEAPPYMDLANYVLSKFAPEEFDVLDKIIDGCAQACQNWINQGTEAAANQWNGTWLIEHNGPEPELNPSEIDC